MNEPKVPDHIEAEFYAEEKRHIAEVVRLIDKYPQFRASFTYALLGSAVAQCDSLGLDVEAWLVGLRKLHPKPAVLAPPKRRQN
jgi:hypothetical protein